MFSLLNKDVDEIISHICGKHDFISIPGTLTELMHSLKDHHWTVSSS